MTKRNWTQYAIICIFLILSIICNSTVSLAQPVETMTPEQYDRNYRLPGFTSATASSFIPPETYGSDYYIYEPSMVLDGSYATAWNENAPGKGIGEWIEVSSDSPQWLGGLSIFAGYGEKYKYFSKNQTPVRIRVYFDGQRSEDFVLSADYDKQPNIILFNEPVLVKSIRVEILDVTSTTIPPYEDACITSIVPVAAAPRFLVAQASSALYMEEKYSTYNLFERGYLFEPDLSIDGDLKSAWIAEGAQNESLMLHLDQRRPLRSLQIYGGHHRSDELWAAYAKPARVRLTFDSGETYEAALEPANRLEPSLVILPSPVETRGVRIEFAEVTPGSLYPNLAVSEIVPIPAGAEASAPVIYPQEIPVDFQNIAYTQDDLISRYREAIYSVDEASVNNVKQWVFIFYGNVMSLSPDPLLHVPDTPDDQLIEIGQFSPELEDLPDFYCEDPFEGFTNYLSVPSLVSTLKPIFGREIVVPESRIVRDPEPAELTDPAGYIQFTRLTGLRTYNSSIIDVRQSVNGSLIIVSEIYDTESKYCVAFFSPQPASPLDGFRLDAITSLDYVDRLPKEQAEDGRAKHFAELFSDMARP